MVHRRKTRRNYSSATRRAYLIKVPPVPYYPSGRSVAQALAWLYRAVRECSSTFNKFELLAGRCAARRARKDGFFAGACR